MMPTHDDAKFELTDSFGFLINRLARAVESDFDRALSVHGLSSPGWAILKLAEALGPISRAEMASLLGLAASNVSRQCERLAGRGLILETPDASDRRSRLVALTDAGRTLLPRLEVMATEGNARWLSALPEAARPAFLNALRVLLDSSKGQGEDAE